MRREITNDDVCESCRRHILREIAKKIGGKTVNCMAYGCENWNKTGRICQRSWLIEFCLNETKKYLKEIDKEKECPK